ncbi:MAG: hypothetical protein J07HQW2_02610 [Haloquadratum walsbyi J07HQW2]|jgi:hypothetical protein|uniref:Uncharacterized protein n=2 Tax=Haloquadratum walsbyi TaxID=293091 RepID=U1PUS7_9EURY|nr:MAG: hypothetical protein J07HQW2_02610 [Haloquadratum walsbyi J07HQW2]
MSDVSDDEQAGEQKNKNRDMYNMQGQSVTRSDNKKKQPDDDTIDKKEILRDLGELEGWNVDNYAARVHYQGENDRYSIEFYAPSECVLYWKVKGDGETAVPVGRMTVPDPLRTRIRSDLADAGIDPSVEDRTL